MIFGYELISAIVAMILAQVVKLILGLFLDGKLNPGVLISTGGMPSSHTALTAALTTGFALSQGIQSPFFSLSLVFTLIVAHDAAGVRWQAGKHASEINKLRDDLQKLFQTISTQKPPETNRKQLKELLGHKPLEVFMGALLGIIVTYLLYSLVFI